MVQELRADVSTSGTVEPHLGAALAGDGPKPVVLNLVQPSAA
jgi:hypothetical protein